MLGIFLISFASAGWFDWLIKPSPEPYKPAFNISNDFTIPKTTLSKEPICLQRNRISLLSKTNECKYNLLNKKEIHLTTNYFKTNSQGITRFSNE